MGGALHLKQAGSAPAAALASDVLGNDHPQECQARPSGFGSLSPLLLQAGGGTAALPAFLGSESPAVDGGRLRGERGRRAHRQLLLPLPPLLISSQVECREFSGEGGCAPPHPSQSAVPGAVFLVSHFQDLQDLHGFRTPPPSPLSALRGV